MTTQAPTLDAIADLGDAVAALNFDAAMRRIDAARRDWIGAGLLTINRNATPRAEPGATLRLQRIWTSDTAAYPVGGTKTKPPSDWTRRLFGEQRLVVTQGAAAMARTFDDHAVMAGLGLDSAINVPIVDDGRCVAAFNLLGAGSSWSDAQVTLARILAALAATVVLRRVRSAAEAAA